MADANIKKITIDKTELPAVDSSNFSYNVRYRIISEDKNRTSHWSRIHNIPATVPTIVNWNYIKQTFTTSTGGTVTNISFDWTAAVSNGNLVYDVFIKKCSTISCTESYVYAGTTTTPKYTFTQTGAETYVQILVQMPTYPKAVNASAKILESTTPILI